MRERFQKMQAESSLEYLLNKGKRVLELYERLFETADPGESKKIRAEILTLESTYARDRPCGAEYTDFSKEEE